MRATTTSTPLPVLVTASSSSATVHSHESVAEQAERWYTRCTPVTIGNDFERAVVFIQFLGINGLVAQDTWAARGASDSELFTRSERDKQHLLGVFASGAQVGFGLTSETVKERRCKCRVKEDTYVSTDRTAVLLDTCAKAKSPISTEILSVHSSWDSFVLETAHEKGKVDRHTQVDCRHSKRKVDSKLNIWRRLRSLRRKRAQAQLIEDVTAGHPLHNRVNYE